MTSSRPSSRIYYILIRFTPYRQVCGFEKRTKHLLKVIFRTKVSEEKMKPQAVVVLAVVVVCMMMGKENIRVDLIWYWSSQL
jgi:hypothetical protein